ncbi:MAG: HD domain-containing protein [Solirubrobacterales bacterium]
MTARRTPLVDAAAERSALVRSALETATDAHAGQVRNGSGGLPYIEHPKMVTERLAAAGYGDEVLAAGLLHDVVEDSDTTIEQLRERFGEEVAALVAALSDDEGIESYRARKQEHRRRIEAVDGDALAIYAADKLTNSTTLSEALSREGAGVADEFKVPLELKLEIWEADAALLERLDPELPFLADLEDALSRLRADLAVADPRPGT